MLQWNTFDEIIKNDLWFLGIRWVDFNSSNLSGDFYFTDGENNGRVDMRSKYVYWKDQIINLQYQDFEQDKELRITSYAAVDNGFEFWSERVSDVIKLDHMIYECYEREMVRPTDESQEWVYTDNIRTVECEDEGNCTNVTIEWIESGEICNGVNKHKRLQMVYMGEALDQYKLGDVVELDSSECGTYEYKEEWGGTLCGSELKNMGFDADETSKYRVLEGWIKPIDSSEWEKIECGYILDYELVRANSFDCGYRATKTTTEIVLEDVCGDEASIYIPDLDKYNKYDIYLTTVYITSPIVTDDMSESEWVWDIESQTYSYDTINTECCECGYRISGYDKKDVYEYVCADVNLYDSYGDMYNSGYTYYKKYKYEKCKDDSNLVWTDEFIYFKPTHSTSAVTSYIYDPETDANTTQRITTYRMYWDENDDKWYVVTCAGDNGVIDIKEYPKSPESGYRERWFNDGIICCGGLPIDDSSIGFEILYADSDGWIRNGINTFTSKPVYGNGQTILTVYFTVQENCTLFVDYDLSSDDTYSLFGYTAIDGSSMVGEARGVTTGTLELFVKAGQHTVSFLYQTTGNHIVGRDNVIITLYAGDAKGECVGNGKYNKQQFQYSVDSGTTWISTGEYRYGSLIEANSEECGYVPTLEQWVLICPDITYDEAEDGDECVVCQQYNNAPSMFAIEKKQISYDRGVSWSDIIENGSIVTRTERLLKWKAPKCGYVGDIFEERWTDEYCENGHKYGTKTIWASSDNGETWFKVEGSERVEIKEYNSGECEEGAE